MFFVIFKLPRTGSTRIAKYLNRAPGVACAHEALNEGNSDNYEAEISKRLDSISVNQDNIGFSINPFKHSIDSSTFFNPQPYMGVQEDGVSISLIREDTLQQSISFWLSNQLNMWPGDGDAPMASKLQSYIAQGGIRIPPRQIRPICRRLLRRNSSLVSLSREYANRHKLRLLEITYEGIYQPPNSDVMKLQSALDITLDPELVTPSKKVLPAPQDWVANFDQLADRFSLLKSD